MATVQIYTSTGRSGGTVSLPSEIFGKKENLPILSQAARVYGARKHQSRGRTKTRSEVARTTAKWYRQKGTGRARHGSKSAPIFVGGGIAHGPRGERRVLFLSKKMKSVALFSALSQKLKEKAVFVVDVKGITGKTKEVSNLLSKIGLGTGRLLVLHGGEKEFIRAIRNLTNIKLIAANIVNAYEVIAHPQVVITREGLAVLDRTFGKSTPEAEKKAAKMAKK